MNVEAFPLLAINQTIVLETFFFLEYHIFGYLHVGGYYQNHVDSNTVLLGCSYHCLFLEHGLNCILMREVINFMFNGIVDEAVANDGTKFVCFYVTSFIIRFNSCTTKLG
jgi:hypothetical protein